MTNDDASPNDSIDPKEASPAPGDGCAEKKSDRLFRIVRAKEPDDDLDLDLDDAESDRRYGREDIADK